MKSAQVNIYSASNASSSNGSAIDVNQIVSASFQIVTTDATAAGTFKLQFSNDLPTTDRQNFVPTNWTDIPSASAVMAAGVAPGIVIANMAFSYIRVSFTRSAGAAVLTKVNMNQLSV